MDLSTTAKWFSELEAADDPSFLQQWGTQATCFDPRFNPAAFTSSSRKLSDIQKESSFPSVNIISFGESRTVDVIKSETDVMSNGEINFHDATTDFVSGAAVDYSVKGTGVNRTTLQAQDHILAERKRRQKLTDRFIALSAIVPGLKKLDKASVLGGAIKYLKELEEKQQALENKRRQSSVASASKRPRPSSASYDHDTDTSSSDVEFEGQSSEIQVRISGDNLLLRIYCSKTNGIMNEMLREIEKLPISVTSSNAMPFGNTTLCVTIIAQVDGDSGMTAQELATNIREVVVKLV